MEGLKNPVEEILAKYKTEGKVITEEEMDKARSEIDKKMKEPIEGLICFKFIKQRNEQ